MIRKTGIKIAALLTLPAGVAALTFALFSFFQDESTAEARIRINVPDTVQDSAQVHDSYVRQRVQHIMSEMQAPAPVQLLSYAVAAHTLTSRRHSAAVQALEAQHGSALLADMAVRFGARAETLDTAPVTDSLETAVLQQLGYLPAQLAARLAVIRIPGMPEVRVQLQGQDPHQYALIVNTYCRLYVTYHQVVEEERLSADLLMLEQLMAQKKKELDEKAHQLRIRQDAYEAATRMGQNPLYQKMLTLEKIREDELMHLETIRSAMRMRRGQTGQFVAVRYTADSPVPDTADLAAQLGASLARIAFVSREIERLEEARENQAIATIQPVQQEVNQAYRAYLSLQDRLKQTEQALEMARTELIVSSKASSRSPSPLAGYLMAAMTGFSSFLLWLVFLVRNNFFQRPTHAYATRPQIA
ncbi:MAG: hypothetical protein SF053_02595 [Bacteroidia bacterium]|nr:hypothetical protein [Bacteroidia bacterium]